MDLQSTDANVSKITGGSVRRIFCANVLGKHEVQYFECLQTGFIQTEEPYWLDEAYSDAVSAIDVGCVSRNLQLASRLESIIEFSFPKAASFIDFGGGYGLLVRLMRDKGYQFFWSDLHCQNLFARRFTQAESGLTRFDVLTAFEVFEHLPDPTHAIASMFELSPTIIFSTELVPPVPPRSAEDWWYFVPEAGQHVSFYTSRSLQVLAERFEAQLYSDGQRLHILTRAPVAALPFTTLPENEPQKKRFWPFRSRCDPQPERVVRTSLLNDDFLMIRSEIRSQRSATQRVA